MNRPEVPDGRERWVVVCPDGRWQSQPESEADARAEADRLNSGEYACAVCWQWMWLPPRVVPLGKHTVRRLES